MSSNKRKRRGDDGQSQDDNSHKQKRPRSNGRAATTDLDGDINATDSQEGLEHNDGAPEADTTNPAPEVHAVEARGGGKRKSRKRQSNPTLEANGASTVAQSEVKVDRDISIPDGEVAKVTPEEQEAKRHRRKEKKREAKGEKNAAKRNQEIIKADQEHNPLQHADPNGAARVSDNIGILQNSDNIMDGAAKISTDVQEAKAQKRKEGRKKHKKKWDKMTTAESAASGAAKTQKEPKKLSGSSQKERSNKPTKSKSDKHSRHKSSSRKKSRDETAPTWRVSDSTGGCMLRIDPLISPGEE